MCVCACTINVPASFLLSLLQFASIRMNKLVISTYRSILRVAKKADCDPAVRSALIASPRSIYSHQSNEWQQADVTKEWAQPRRVVDDFIYELNGRPWYWPPVTSTGPVVGQAEAVTNALERSRATTCSSFSDKVREAFRKNSFSNGAMNTTFAALKALSPITTLTQSLPRDPLYPPFCAGLQPRVALPTAAGKLLDDDNTVQSNDPMYMLVAHPVMPGCFEHTIVLITQLSSDLTLGLVVNMPFTNDDGVLIPAWSIVPEGFHPLFTTHLAQHAVMVGGPVQSPSDKQQALYVVHKFGGVTGARCAAPGIYISGNLDEINKILDEKRGKPEDVMVMMGYSSWGSHQLQGEIEAGSWLPLCKEPEKDIQDTQKACQNIVFRSNSAVDTDHNRTPKRAQMWVEGDGRAWRAVRANVPPCSSRHRWVPIHGSRVVGCWRTLPCSA